MCNFQVRFVRKVQYFECSSGTKMWHFILVFWLLGVRGQHNLPAGSEPQVTDESTVSEASISVTYSPSRTISPLKGLAHGVSSGKIKIFGNDTFFISNFHFDGEAPNAHFLVGKGKNIDDSGTVLPLTESPDKALEKFNGENVTLTLPKGLTVDNIDWLAVWSLDDNQNLGYVFLKASLQYPPQTFGLKHIVTSGPVVLVDKKTLFVPAFRYSGNHKDVHFWVGNGTKPDAEGVEIPIEDGSSSLRPYQGQNLYLHLPDGVTTDNIDYFGVWSKEENTCLGHVMLTGQDSVPEAPEPKDERNLSDEMVMRLPKCCPFDNVITFHGCEESSLDHFSPYFNVYEHNETHFNNVTLDLDKIRFEPYVYNVQCPEGKYYLDAPEEFALLKNGSLLLRGVITSGIFSQQDFCLETIDGDDFMRIFMCVPEHKIQQAMFVTYVTLTIISTLCFAGTFFLYFFWLKIEDIHRKCFTAYVSAMAITFLSLTIVQLAYIEDSGCNVLGFLFQYSMITSFTLLAILCFDNYIIVKHIDKDAMKKLRRNWYIGVALAIPILSIIISLARNQTPDVPNSFFKPQYRKNSCAFPEEKQRSVYFYLPIVASIIVGFVFLALTKMLIVRYERENATDAIWLDNKLRFKFMLRKLVIVTAVSCLWPVEIIMQLYAPTSGILVAFEIIEASQGIIVLLLFVLNKETRRLLLKRIKAGKKQMERQNNIAHEEVCMMDSLNIDS